MDVKAAVPRKDSLDDLIAELGGLGLEENRNEKTLPSPGVVDPLVPLESLEQGARNCIVPSKVGVTGPTALAKAESVAGSAVAKGQLLAPATLKPLRDYQAAIVREIQLRFVSLQLQKSRPPFTPSPAYNCWPSPEEQRSSGSGARPQCQPHEVDTVALLRQASCSHPSSPVPSSALLYLPTGGGKTRIAAECVRWLTARPGTAAAGTGARVLFIVNRLRLVDQAAAAFREAGCGPLLGYIVSGRPAPPPHATVIIAMSQTLAAQARAHRRQAEEAAAAGGPDDTPTGASRDDSQEAPGAGQTAEAQSTAASLVASFYPVADLVIIDEAHGAVSSTYSHLLAHYRSAPGSGSFIVGQEATATPEGSGDQASSLALRCKHTFILGLTATPLRLDPSQQLSSVFEVLLRGPSVTSLVRQGVLVPPVTLSPGTDQLRAAVQASVKVVRKDTSVLSRHSGGDGDDDADEEDAGGMVRVDQKRLEDALGSEDALAQVVAAWKQRCVGRRTVAFAVTVSQAVALAEAFRDAAVPALAVDGSQPLHERERAYGLLREGKVKVLASVGVISEGFDEPTVSAVILLRPTASRGLYVQQVGRGLRCVTTGPCIDGEGTGEEGSRSRHKQDCIVLDFAGNALLHGPVTRPILSDMEGAGDTMAARGMHMHAYGSSSKQAGRYGKAWVCLDASCRAVMSGVESTCSLCGRLHPRLQRSAVDLLGKGGHSSSGGGGEYRPGASMVGKESRYMPVPPVVTQQYAPSTVSIPTIRSSASAAGASGQRAAPQAVVSQPAIGVTGASSQGNTSAAVPLAIPKKHPSMVATAPVSVPVPGRGAGPLPTPTPLRASSSSTEAVSKALDELAAGLEQLSVGMRQGSMNASSHAHGRRNTHLKFEDW